MSFDNRKDRLYLDPAQIQLLKDVDLHLTLSNLLYNGY